MFTKIVLAVACFILCSYIKSSLFKAISRAYSIILCTSGRAVNMQRVKRNAKFIQLLIDSKFSPAQRQFILKAASKDQVLSLGEILVNVLKGNLVISAQQTTNLSKYKQFLRKVGQEGRLSWKVRRDHLTKSAPSLFKVLVILEKQIKQVLT